MYSPTPATSAESVVREPGEWGQGSRQVRVDQSGQMQGAGNRMPHSPKGSLVVGTESEMSPTGSGFKPYSPAGRSILGSCGTFRKFGGRA